MLSSNDPRLKVLSYVTDGKRLFEVFVVEHKKLWLVDVGTELVVEIQDLDEYGRTFRLVTPEKVDSRE